MRRAAVFHDAQEPGGDLILHAIVKKNDAIRHILLKPVTRQLTLATFAGNDCGEVSFLEPCEQAAELAAHNRGIGQSREQVLNGIEHDPFCADGIDRIAKPDKKSLQIKRTGFLVFAPLDLNLIDEQLFLSDKTRKIVAKRGDVLRNVLGALLEGYEDARLAESQRAFRQEGHAKQGLSTIRGAAEESGPAGRKPAFHDGVQAIDSGGCFAELRAN